MDVPTTNIQMLENIGNARIHKVAAINPGLYMMIEKVTII
jgi:hypothetical protein